MLPLYHTVDLFGDVWLIASPLYMLYDMKLPRQQIRLLSAIFNCGIFATASNLVHIYYVIKTDPILVVVTAHIQVCLLIFALTLRYLI